MLKLQVIKCHLYRFSEYVGDANSWLFTRGFKLVGGKTNLLNFEYYAYPMNSEDDVSALEVKYGRGAGAAGMNQGTFFYKPRYPGIGIYGPGRDGYQKGYDN